MTQTRWTQVDDYFSQLFAPPDQALDDTLAACTAAGLPPQNVAPNQGKLLWMLARLLGAKSILEIGTLRGYSTIWLARGLPPGGVLFTLESNPHHAKVAGENIARAGLSHIVEILVGPALESLPRLAEDDRGRFDPVFIDAGKPSNPEYFTWALKLTRPGSVIIADNVVRNGRVIDVDSSDPSIKGIRQLNEMVANEPRVSATAIQTVGAKGHDGFAIVLVTA